MNFFESKLDDVCRKQNERRSFQENLAYEFSKYKRKADAVARMKTKNGKLNPKFLYGKTKSKIYIIKLVSEIRRGSPLKAGS